jgi:hypothetical protein
MQLRDPSQMLPECIEADSGRHNKVGLTVTLWQLASSTAARLSSFVISKAGMYTFWYAADASQSGHYPHKV